MQVQLTLASRSKGRVIAQPANHADPPYELDMARWENLLAHANWHMTCQVRAFRASCTPSDIDAS